MLHFCCVSAFIVQKQPIITLLDTVPKVQWCILHEIPHAVFHHIHVIKLGLLVTMRIF